MAVLPVGFGASGGYTIDRSLRFRASASAYLNRTPASAGNRKTFTISFWMKRGASLSDNYLFEAYLDNANRSFIRFGSDSFIFAQTGTVNNLITTQVFRDPSAWYHFVLAVDTTQATSSNRIKLYVNGTQVTAFSTAAYPSQNADYQFSNSVAHYVARSGYNGGYGYFDGYITEINFIDGQALDPTSFGEYNDDTGVWQPKKYVGTYGTNGFYLNFSDNSSTTTLGEDGSGNGNDWTLNNFSLTSGSTYDSMTDVPTLTSEDAANYAVLNPLAGNTSATVSNANLRFAPSAAAGNKQATIGVSSGKWYWELTIASLSSYQTNGITSNASTATAYDENYGYASDGRKWVAATPSTYGASYTTGDVIAFALDMDAGTLTAYKNNSSQGTLTTGLTGTMFPLVRTDGTGTIDANFGQRPFAYTPPTGFKSLNTYNLPDSTIVDGGEYFNATTYTGDGTDNRLIANSSSMDTDLVWIKGRSSAYNNILFDSLRGNGNYLSSNSTGQENFAGSLGWTNSGAGTGGFVVDYGTNPTLNETGTSYVGWQWKANGSGVSNTDGSITSTVSANTTAGFSIVNYTGTGVAGTVGHGLGVAPAMVIQKNRSSASTHWPTWHKNLSSPTNGLYLSTAGAQFAATVFYSAAPNASTFTVQTDLYVNSSGQNYVAYCFTEVEGYSKFGSYTGNGSADGPFVYTGFRPAFVLFKRTDSTSDWHLYDTTRSTYNVIAAALYADISNAENSGQPFDILSNGFKLRVAGGELNTSSATIIYAAFAENPFKNALAR